jgi:hypothetical protein
MFEIYLKHIFILKHIYLILQKRCIKEPEMTEDELLTASKNAKASSLILTFTLLILWPLPLFFSDYIFSLVFFRGWVVFAIMWVC